MKSKPWIKKVRLSDADQADRHYYTSLTPERRLEIVQELREIAHKFGYEDRKNYEEFLGLLSKHKARYCVIGSFALAVHAKPRYTKDMDILIDPTRNNAKVLLQVLEDFGFDSPDLTEEDFLDPEQVIQIGYEPVRIDIFTSIAGCSFSDAWESRTTARYGSIEAFFIGRQALIRSKRASGRKQDLADLELLEATD